MRHISAEFRHAKVPGGGFVTGFVFHEKKPGVLYARTDIGGVYRYMLREKTWVSLCDGVTHPGHWETFPLSIALSAQGPNKLFIAAGDNHINRLCTSKDYGETFVYHDIPAPVHGNAPGRGTGERLYVSRSDENRIWFASQTRGLLKSTDGGRHFEALNVMGEQNLTLFFAHPENEDFILVGTNGYANRLSEEMRGPSVYFSTDGGKTFSVLPGQPEAYSDPQAMIGGFVAQRVAFDGRYLYITFNMSRDCWRGFDNYACDTGSAFDGALTRYEISAQGEILSCKDITPGGYGAKGKPIVRLGFGLGGISAAPGAPGTIYAASICRKEGGDILFMSRDFGETFAPILNDLSVGHIDFTVPYMKPRYNGNHSIVHWMADLKLDPHNGDFAVFTTGTGIFATFNLTDAWKGETVSWEPLCDGLEETVHLNVYSPPHGAVQLLDIIGDLGGFAFKDLDKPCENSFADARGNRYITCMNADFTDQVEGLFCVTARGNWTGHTKGGLILSEDDCETWERLPMPYGLTPYIDSLLAAIERPNVNAGWTALSSDGTAILWSIAEGNRLPATALVRTTDRGFQWERCRVLDLAGSEMTDEARTLKVFSDRVHPHVFYGFGQHFSLYVSVDGGGTFRQKPAPAMLPDIDPTGIDGQQHYEIRPAFFISGVFYVSAQMHGLFKISYDMAKDRFTAKRVTPLNDAVYRVGLGKPKAEGLPQTLFINGILGGVYGFYASFDGGKTWASIGDERHMFGDIRSIAGDIRRFGRFYVATGSRGAVYGDLVMP